MPEWNQTRAHAHLSSTPKSPTDLLTHRPTSALFPDNAIKWFWNAMEGLTQDERSQFIRFVWGRSRLPLKGRPWPQTFKIQRQGGVGDETLPVTHTCFFSIEWPAYSTAAIARDRLLPRDDPTVFAHPPEPHAPAIQATNATTAAASATHTYDGAANSWAKSEVNRSANDEASCDTSCEMAAVSTASCEASFEASREMASVSTASIISSSGPARSLSNGNLGGRGGAGGGGEGDGRAGGGAGDSAGAGAGGTEC